MDLTDFISFFSAIVQPSIFSSAAFFEMVGALFLFVILIFILAGTVQACRSMGFPPGLAVILGFLAFMLMMSGMGSSGMSAEKFHKLYMLYSLAYAVFIRLFAGIAFGISLRHNPAAFGIMGLLGTALVVVMALVERSLLDYYFSIISVVVLVFSAAAMGKAIYNSSNMNYNSSIIIGIAIAIFACVELPKEYAVKIISQDESTGGFMGSILLFICNQTFLIGTGIGVLGALIAPDEFDEYDYRIEYLFSR